MIQRLDSVWRKGLPPGSLQAYSFALACFLFAMTVQTALSAVNGDISPFRSYFPAILVATLVGGGQAGVLVLVLGLIAGWDSMVQPLLLLNVPSLAQAEDIVFFALTSAAIVWFAESYRLMLRGAYAKRAAHAPSLKETFLRAAKNVAASVPQWRPSPRPARAPAQDGEPPKPPAQLPRAIQPAPDTVARYAKQLNEIAESLIPRGGPAVLAGFHEQASQHEPAIWLGAKVLLSSLGVAPSLVPPDGFERGRIAADLKDGAIVMHGLDFAGEDARERDTRLQILTAFPDRRAVVLPQAVTFRDIAELRRTAAALASHRDLTLLSASMVSHHLLRQYFGAKAKILMAPHVAFALGPQSAVCDPLYDTVWLSRSAADKTAVRRIELLMGLTGLAEQPVAVPASGAGLPAALSGKTNGRSALFTDVQNNLAVVENSDPDAVAETRLQRIRTILSLGHIAVTDSLQGHILCLLMNKPHVFVSDDAGKNWDFYDTWTRVSPLCRFARNLAAAWTMASSGVAKARELNKEGPVHWSWN